MICLNIDQLYEILLWYKRKVYEEIRNLSDYTANSKFLMILSYNEYSKHIKVKYI